MIVELPRAQLAPGYTVSRLLKGGWQLAGGHGPVDAAAAMADMDRFVDAGITTFDCADIYTGVEALIGEWLKRRARGAGVSVQVHTKYVPDLERLPTHSRADVERGVDRSLARLGVDRLDLVQLHWWDYEVPGYVDAAAWLDELRRAGKIRHIGLTNFDQKRLSEIVTTGIPVVSHQLQYSVLDRRPANAVAAQCAHHGIGLLCYGALAGGFLSDRYLGRPDPASPLENRSLVKYRLIIDEFGGWEPFQDMLAVLGEVAARHGVGIGAVAIRWVLDQPGVSGVIVGARHARHLDQARQACVLALDDDDRAAVARVQSASSGPSGDVYDLERVKGGPHASIMRYTLA
ncbi:MAG: aldo/keto reductase [Acidobacteria bacterium 13_1_40CM_65_14]|nr:MAG: aldo/keto reductase [Acidobacteria bacterium 13_1_40CM_65_14]